MSDRKRLPQLADSDSCVGCGGCVDVCAKNAIHLQEDKNGFLIPIVSEVDCISCGACEAKCSVLSPMVINHTYKPIPYAAYSKNEAIRFRGASGGAFGQIAFDFLSVDRSIVIGAVLEGKRVEHIAVNHVGNLHKLQNSKYIQSNTSGIYRTIKKYLLDGYRVLFSGTPCQIAAIYSFFPQDKFKQLYTAELVCHGVPSMLILDSAMKWSGASELISFRTKEREWNQLNTQKMVYDVPIRHDWFYTFFKSDLFLRKSCYDCPYGKLPRIADIALADLWTDEPKYKNAPLGNSLVLCNTDKGGRLLNMSEGLHKEVINWDVCLPRNRHVYSNKRELKGWSLSQYLSVIAKWNPWVIKLLLSRNKKYNPVFWAYSYRLFQRMALRQKKELKKIMEELA